MSSVNGNVSGVPEDLLPSVSNGALRTVLHATNHPSDDRDHCLIAHLGIDPAFIADPSDRTLEVYIHTGRPKVNPDAPGPSIKVMLKYPMISYNMIVGDHGNFRMIAIGSTERTHFAFVRGKISFAFYVPRSSVTMEDAIMELLYNNLIKGPRAYEKTASIIDNFYEKVLQCIFPDPVVLNTIITSFEGEEMPCRIYFDSEAPDDAMISIGGYVYGYNVNQYPRDQIQRTLKVVERKEKRDRRATHRSPNHMDHRERAAMNKRLEEVLGGAVVTTSPLEGTVVKEESAVNIVDGVV